MFPEESPQDLGVSPMFLIPLPITLEDIPEDSAFPFP